MKTYKEQKRIHSKRKKLLEKVLDDEKCEDIVGLFRGKAWIEKDDKMLDIVVNAMQINAEFEESYLGIGNRAATPSGPINRTVSIEGVLAEDIGLD